MGLRDCGGKWLLMMFEIMQVEIAKSCTGQQ
jgi:hypothetical protein